MKGYKQIIYVV